MRLFFAARYSLFLPLGSKYTKRLHIFTIVASGFFVQTTKKAQHGVEPSKNNEMNYETKERK